MDNFSIESANKVIKVNDVELSLNFDDSIFMNNLADLGEKLKNYEPTIGSDTSSLAISIDSVFGEKTCEKIFKCKAPNAVLIIQFVSYINKYVEDYKDNYIEKIKDKYNPDRLGESDV